jgi:chorismate synthase
MFRVTTCGESYGTALLIIVDGVPPGLPLENADIQEDLDRRRPGTSPIDSPRLETDQVDIVAGVRDGFTTGAPVGMVICNVDRQDVHVEQYRSVKDLIRPGHAEYTFFVKYGEYADWCGAGRASGRETAGRVAGGALAKKILLKEGIEIVGFVKELYGIRMRDMSYEDIKANQRKNIINCPDLEIAEKMIAKCLDIKAEGDTCGGIVEVIARGVPAGLGEPVFDKLSADLAKGLMSIGAVKGFEIGAGFGVAKLKGSQCNDIPYVDENGRVRFRTNRCGGFLGGISNGEDLVMRIAVKPTATISIPQETVDMKTMKNARLGAITRRDPTICARIVPVAEAMAAATILDHLMMWRGYKNTAKIDNPWDPER